MNISSVSVRRGVTFAMAYLVVFGFGLFSLARLQLDLYPDISFPVVMIITTYTGASPEDIETLISRPIEGAVSSAKDAEEVRSTSKQGISLVEVHFDWGKDMEFAETDVRRKLEMVKGFLPEDADDSMVFAFDPSLQPIVMATISGPYPLDELRNIAEDDVIPRLSRLPGIADANVEGGLDRQIHVYLDPVKVAAFGLDVNAVVGAVYRENTQVPGGAIEQGTLDFTIQARGKYRNVEEIGEVVVGMKTIDGMYPAPIRLKEVARVVDGYYENQRILEVDGKPAVWLMVRKQSGANTVRAAEAVVAAFPEIKRAAAAEIDFRMVFNQADFINLSLGNLSTTALFGVGITFFVLFFFLRNFRSALIVATAIPLSVITTFAVMDQADMTLNVLSMAGLALSVGMLVDNAIVVLENIFRLRQGGADAWDAAAEGAKNVGTAVTASTLTTIAVFVPVLFVPGIAGVMFRDMAVTICFSLAVSLIVALTFIPLAASRLLGGAAVAENDGQARKDVFDRFRETYGRHLDWALAHRWVVGVGLFGALAGTAVLAIALPTEFVAKDDQSMVFVSAETPIGTNLQEAAGILREVTERVAGIVPEEDRRMVALDVGVGKGFVSIFAKGVHAGVIRVPLVPMGRREKSQQDYEELVEEALEGIPGLKASAAMPFDVMGGDSDIEVQIRGHDLKVSRGVGLELERKLEAFPEIRSVTFSMADQKPEVRILFDRIKMASLGLSTAAVGNAISAAFRGRIAGRYAEGGDEYDIVVRYGKKHRLDLDEIHHMPVVTPSGAVVPLANVARLEVGLGPVDISRLDQERVTRLKVKLKDEYQDAEGKWQRKDLMGAIGHVKELLEAYPWPDEFGHHIGGSAEDFMTSFQYLGLALAVSVLLVYMVMASQFESLRQPFIILFSVPLAAIGVVLMFTLTRSTMDISALIGVIMLVGIVVNNGIVMVDAANQFRLQGKARVEAIALAARLRMRPVLMTSITTISAMVPLALEIGEGSAGWGGLARAVIGGLLAATALTLFVVPTMYTFFARKNYRDRVSMAPGSEGAPS